MTILLQCESTTYANLPSGFINPAIGVTESKTVPLTRGRVYPAVAIASHVGGFWFMVEDDDELGYPMWYPAPLFSVVDGRVPPNWVLGQFASHETGYFSSIISFEKWARDNEFIQRLYDRDADTRFIYENNVRPLREDARVAASKVEDDGPTWM
jgi:hypothetical protein